MEYNYDRELSNVMSKYTVELLKEEDFEWCVEVASVRMLTEEVKRPELVDIPTLYLIVRKMYLDKSAVVAKVDGEYAGAIGGYLHPNILNPNIATMAELMWYVLPEYRRTRVGALLLREYDKITNSSPAHEATLSLLGDSPIKVSSLEKRGFKQEELAFRRQVKEYTWQQ